MRKLFTLAAAVLASFSLWAVVPATTLDPTDVPTEGWAGKYAPASVVNGDWVCFSPYEIYQSAAQTWAATDKGASTSASWNAIDPIPAQSAWTQNDGKAATLRDAEGTSDQKGAYYYRITNTTDVAVLAKSGSDGKRTISLAAYELTDGEPAETPAQSATMEKNENTVISISNLYADKEYLVVVKQIKGGSKGTSEGNSTYCAIGFKTVTKTIVSTVETLTNAKINGVALDPNFLSELIDTKSVEVLNAYTTAPTVTFTKHVVITYDDESTKESDVDVEVVAEALGLDKWAANITLGDDTYLITMPRATAYTVTYKFEDESVLGTEVVAAGGHPAEYAQYEVMPLATFNGWYDSDYLETVDLSQVVVNSDTSFYADFDKAFAKSIDFEGMVINNGKSYNVKSALAANFYDYKNIDALDSLNNEKGAARNEPYLGLKIKKQGGYLACNVLPGTTIRIKFGYVAETVLAIAGGDTLRLAPTNNKIAELQFPIMVETLVKLQTTSDKTVVIKQIMIDEPLVTWMYPINYAETENGKVEGWTIAFPNETVTLTATPAEGYKVSDVQVDGVSLNAVENVYSFEMPAKEVTVSATFERLPVVEYNITIAEMQNGSVTADKQKAAEGELVTLTVSPAEGYKINDVKVNDISLNENEGVYSFIMLAEEVTITATFVEDEPVIVTEYNITIAEMQNGSVTADKAQAAKGEIVTLTVTPAEGYKIADVKVNNVSLNAVEGVYSFEMPEEDVTITASFSSTEGFENIDASKQAVKVILNGQLLIKKGDKLFDAQGAVVK